MAIARGEEPGNDHAVAGAIAALRAFKTARTTEELAWVYTTELPRDAREGLCAAFEDLPRTVGARSGLISALRDPESKLRLRAFRLLLQYGASTRDEIEWLLGRIMDEKVSWVRDRMARLLASHAEGEGAREFLARWTTLLNVNPALRKEATAALENLRDPRLLAEAGDRILDSYEGPVDLSLLRLLTRLRGERADRYVAGALREARANDDVATAIGILVALRHGGDQASLAAAADALEDARPDVRDQAMRTLLQRGDPRALDALGRRFADLPIDERMDALSLARLTDRESAGRLLTALLATESDMLVQAALIERIGELRCDVAGAVLPFTDAEHPTLLRIRSAETLSMIDDPRAATRLAELLEEGIESAPWGTWAGDIRLRLESFARAAARTGDVSFATRLARLLFSRAGRLRALQYDTDAAFAFEETVLGALLDLASTSRDATSVSAAIEQVVDAQADSGELFLFPKALFTRLAKPLEKAGPTFRPLRAEFLRLSLLLPPSADRRELSATVALARLATEERDHEAAARHLRHAILLIDYHGVEGARFLREALGQPDPLTGADPRLRLHADVELAWARHHRVVDPERGLDHYARAVAITPHDAWLRLRVAGELLDDGLDRDAAVRHAERALTLAPYDAELVVRVARILAGAGDGDRFDAAHARLRELRDCGLASDRPLHRIGLAEALARLGRADQARTEIGVALELDDSARAWIEDDPALRPLLEQD